MIVERLEVGAFAENCYIVGCEETHHGVVIDPGDEVDRIIGRIGQLHLDIQFVLLTHAHLDHVKELNAFKSEIDVPVLMHKDDLFLLESLPEQAAAFGMVASGIPAIDRYVDEGEAVDCGKLRFEILHTPGHSPGSVTYVEKGVAFVGDVLFAGSIGRTDLPGGDFETLMRSIRAKLLPLGDGTDVYSGHGPPTTIGRERQFNPFLTNT